MAATAVTAPRILKALERLALEMAAYGERGLVLIPMFDLLVGELLKVKHSRSDMEAAYRVAANLVALHGEQFLPVFEHMENVMAKLDRKAALMEKARQVAYGCDG